MNRYDSKTVGRKNMGFASPDEYREAAEGLKRHQDRLYEIANETFKKIEAQRGNVNDSVLIPSAD